MRKKSMLSDHKFEKGKFLTPFNYRFKGLKKESAWYYERMPNFLWLGLIIRNGDRISQLSKCMQMINFLYNMEKSSEIIVPSLHFILELPREEQEVFFEYLKELGIIESLRPLSVLLSIKDEVFSRYLRGYELSLQHRIGELNNIIYELSSHQSYLSTDVRFLVIYNFSLTNKFYIAKSEMLNYLIEYPKMSHDEEIMKLYRPVVRANEIALYEGVLKKIISDDYIISFWEKISSLTDCEVFSMEFKNDKKGDLNNLKKVLYKILKYYTEFYLETKPFDNKMQVLLGLLTFSYKRIIELVNHNLENTISGRTIIRSLIENYVMTKYLLQEEKEHDNIWLDYQYYGLGQYKLIFKRYEENNPDIKDSHVPYDYINGLVTEFKGDEFINMDVKYFDKINIRKKFEYVNESDLYKYYYDYDSSYEHGFWGAIRESSFLKCNNPGHQYHIVPDIENMQKLKTVKNDVIMVVKKHLDVLNKVYFIPEYFKKEINEL